MHVMSPKWAMMRSLSLFHSRSSLRGRSTMICRLAAMICLAQGTAFAQDDLPPIVPGGEMVRGTVMAGVPAHLAIKTDKGDAYQVAVSANTKIMKDRQPMRVADIRQGDIIGAMGILDAPTHTVHALLVMVVPAEQAKKAREALGKAYIAGRVTAIDELKLTILRPDGVSQVIAVDEGTSFRKGGRQLQSMVAGTGPVDSYTLQSDGNDGESITLLDIKVGDTVAGKGGLKGGIFVPTQLAVTDPAARHKGHANGNSAELK